MFTYFYLLAFLLPIFSADRSSESDNDFLMQRSAAAHYLFNLPISRYQDRSIDDSTRTKRIYWENLAFHAADYNQKPKKV